MPHQIETFVVLRPNNEILELLLRKDYAPDYPLVPCEVISLNLPHYIEVQLHLIGTDYHPVFRIPHHNVAAIVSGLSREQIRVV